MSKRNNNTTPTLVAPIDAPATVKAVIMNVNRIKESQSRLACWAIQLTEAVASGDTAQAVALEQMISAEATFIGQIATGLASATQARW